MSPRGVAKSPNSWNAWYQDPTTGVGPYRSDRSGYVSAAWGLPAPGHTTYSFAGGPWDSGQSHVIPPGDLLPGDALNSPGSPAAGTGHMMIYASGDFLSGWVEVYEEYTHGQPATHRWRNIDPSLYLPIRYVGITGCGVASAEVCNLVDDDCDPATGDAPDGDGYTLCDGDCDEFDSAVHPGADEGVADGVDQDCDGAELCFVHGDLDSYGALDGQTVASSDLDCGGDGAALTWDDCDDEDPSVHPGEAEDDSEVDRDCDGDSGNGPPPQPAGPDCGCTAPSGRTSAPFLFLVAFGVGRRRRRSRSTGGVSPNGERLDRAGILVDVRRGGCLDRPPHHAGGSPSPRPGGRPESGRGLAADRGRGVGGRSR